MSVPGVPPRPQPCGAHRASGGADIPRALEPRVLVCFVEQKPFLVRGKRGWGGSFRRKFRETAGLYAIHGAWVAKGTIEPSAHPSFSNR